MTDGGLGDAGERDRGARASVERAEAIVAELQHRTRNLMAVVQALAKETALSSATMDAFNARFFARLGALARAQELLTRADKGETALFGDLLEGELAAAGACGGRVTLEGPAAVQLRSGAIQPLALAFHELAANAVEHGALSHDDGRLAVAWSQGPAAEDGRRTLRIEWTESGVATPPSADAPPGFGRQLVEEALRFQLAAETRFDVTPDGVRCVIALPASRCVA